MLQQFQDELLNLTESAHLEKLKKASAELSKKIGRDHTRIQPFLLAAIDPAIDIDNPEILEVKELLTKSWSTFTGVSKDSPLTFIRAVIFDAISLLASDPGIASLCLNLIEVPSNYVDKNSTEQNLINAFISRLSETVEEQGRRLFSPVYTLTSVSAGEVSAIKRSKVDEKLLSKQLLAASNPHDAEGNPIADANPNTPEEENWPAEFAARGAKSIANTLNKALDSQVIEIESAIRSLRATPSPAFADNSGKLKTELLWWKFAGYSQTYAKAYRDLPKGFLEVAVALDFSSLIPPVFPKVVEFFLASSYREISGNPEEKISLADFIGELKNLTPPLNHLPEVTVSGGRCTLYAFIAGVLKGQFGPDELTKRTGLPSDLELSYEWICLWLFRDLHAFKIEHNQ